MPRARRQTMEGRGRGHGRGRGRVTRSQTTGRGRGRGVVDDSGAGGSQFVSHDVVEPIQDDNQPGTSSVQPPTNQLPVIAANQGEGQCHPSAGVGEVQGPGLVGNVEGLAQFPFPQNIGTAEVGLNSADVAPPANFSARQLGAPLGQFLPMTTKEKIWKGEFVDLGTLLVVEEQKVDVPMSFFSSRWSDLFEAHAAQRPSNFQY